MISLKRWSYILIFWWKLDFILFVLLLNRFRKSQRWESCRSTLWSNNKHLEKRFKEKETRLRNKLKKLCKNRNNSKRKLKKTWKNEEENKKDEIDFVNLEAVLVLFLFLFYLNRSLEEEKLFLLVISMNLWCWSCWFDDLDNSD